MGITEIAGEGFSAELKVPAWDSPSLPPAATRGDPPWTGGTRRDSSRSREGVTMGMDAGYVSDEEPRGLHRRTAPTVAETW